MNLRWKTPVLIVGLLLTTCAASRAAVFDDKSPAQKLRADIANQLAQYKKCLADVELACEKTGIFPAAVECDLATGVAALPADPKGRRQVPRRGGGLAGPRFRRGGRLSGGREPERQSLQRPRRLQPILRGPGSGRAPAISPRARPC